MEKGVARAHRFLQDFTALPLDQLDEKQVRQCVSKLTSDLEKDAAEFPWLQQFFWLLLRINSMDFTRALVVLSPLLLITLCKGFWKHPFEWMFYRCNCPWSGFFLFLFNFFAGHNLFIILMLNEFWCLVCYVYMYIIIIILMGFLLVYLWYF